MKKKRTFYEKIYAVFSTLIKKIFRVTITGAENEPEAGGCILCANHTSLLDVLVISASMRRQVRYMAKKELFQVPLIGPLITALGAFPVDRGGNDVSSIRHTIAFVEDGHMIGIFPQGTRHPGVNPRETEVKSGVGMIAYRAKADILPVYVKTAKRKTKFFRRTELLVGALIPYEELAYTSGGGEEYKRASEYIFDQICTLGENAEAE